MLLNLDSFQEKINYSFTTVSLLKSAFTHPSKSKKSDFERLEFLGDRVLGLSISSLLYEEFPKEEEGDLAKRLATLVSKETCLEIALSLQLEAYVLRKNGQDTQYSTILSDVLEALIGALFLDSGFENAKRFVNTLWKDRIIKNSLPPKDAKSALQEWAQKKGLPIPHYEIIKRSGPDHSPIFLIQGSIKGMSPIIEKGASKRQGEQKVAEKFLEIVNKKI